MATRSNVLAWKIPGTMEPNGLPSWGHTESDTTEATQQQQQYAPTSNAEDSEAECFYEDLQDVLELTPPKDVLFVKEDWNAKVGSQETPGVTRKFGLGSTE